MAVVVVVVVETIPNRLGFGSEGAEEEEREEGIECGDQEADDVIPEAEGTFVATAEFAEPESEKKKEIFMISQFVGRCANGDREGLSVLSF